METRSRLRTPLIVGGLVLGLALATLGPASVVRVPEGDLGAVGDRILTSGWHLRPPFRSVRVAPLSGRIAAIDVARRTGEGASVIVRLSLGYRLSPAALGAHAARLAAAGLASTIADLAGEAMNGLPATDLLPSELKAGHGTSDLPPAATEAIARALRAAGIEPLDLEGRVGPAAAFRSGASGKATPPAAAATAPGRPAPVPEATGVRLLMIGLDGADWDTLDPLLRQGRLPNLARLIAGGARAPLRSYDPMISPLLWTTMVTGVGPDIHGVADFQAIDGATGRRVPITSRFRKVKALWNILSDAGKANAFVAWWASYPAEQVDGVQVSNLVAYESLRPKPPGGAIPAGITYPPDYFKEIRPSLRTAADASFEEVRSILRVGRDEFERARQEVLHPGEKDEETANRQAVQQPVSLAISILAGSRNYATIAADLAARHYDLTAVYFEGIDMMGHRFQHCMPPRLALCPDADYARFRDAVTSFYVRQDELLGPILGAAGPGTTVLVVSDHGFKTGAARPADLLPYTTQQPVEWHRESGVFILSGPGTRRGQSLQGRVTLFDIAPTVLYLLGLPSSAEMPGRVLSEAIDPRFLEAHPPRTIPSYEPLGRPRAILAADGAGAADAEEELLSNLRALGYIGGDRGSPPGPAAGGETTQVFYHRNLATYFLKRRDYARAAEQLRLANEKQKLPKTYQMLAEAYAGLGRTDEAIAALEEGLRTIDTMDPEPVLWMVQMRLESAGGRDAAAEEARRFASRTARKPGLDDAIAGLMKEREGDAAAAAALFRRSLRADPTRVVAARRLYALAGPESGPELEPILERALGKDPRIDEYDDLLGAILATAGRTREALAWFRRAADLDPDNARFAANLASALARLGRWEEAAAAYERAAALESSPATFLMLGSAYRRLKRPDRALDAFERARAAGDAGAGPLLGIALSRADMQQIPEALSAVREGLDRHPDDPGLRSLYEDLLRRTRTPGSAPGPPGSGR